MGARELTIGLVGDVRINRALSFLRCQERNKALRAWIGGTDVAIANLEMALTHRGAPADKLLTSRSNPELISELVSCGFSVVTLANNHVTDYGIPGLEDTLEAVDQSGLHRIGAGRDWVEATCPLRIEATNEQVLYIANFACTLPPGAAAGHARPGVAPLRVTQEHLIDPILIQEQPGTSPWVETRVSPQDERAACQLMGRASEEGVVLAIVHWGVPPYWHSPFQGELAAYQRPLARRLIAAGAHAVIGHHPHVLHGMEIIDGRPVFYSLGNFIWHPIEKALHSPNEIRDNEPGYRLQWRRALSVSASDPGKRESVFLRLSWLDGNWRATLIPITLDENGEPEPATAKEAEQINLNLQTLSKHLGCRVMITETGVELAGSLDL
jgi:poly-gamma-glutamate synthesis protein (capsule biosynthesis protein)